MWYTSVLEQYSVQGIALYSLGADAYTVLYKAGVVGAPGGI